MCEGTPLDPVRHRQARWRCNRNIHQQKEKGYGKDKHQRKTLQHRQRGTAQPPQQGTRLHTTGTLPPQRAMVGNEDSRRAGGHKGKVQAAHRTVHAEEGDTHPGGSGRDRGRHDTPAASGLCREVGGTLRNTHVPNLHAQGRRSQCLGRERGNMEAELPCAHDFRLDGRGNGENPETEQAGHGGNADHAGGMPWHGKGHFFRP